MFIDPWSETLPVHNLFGQANAIIFNDYFVTAPENNILSEETAVCFILVSC
jgi:hypothetical protein